MVMLVIWRFLGNHVIDLGIPIKELTVSVTHHPRAILPK
jgi:hypothetical protein